MENTTINQISQETALQYAQILTQDWKHPYGALRAMLGTKLFIRREHGIRFDIHGALHRVTLCDLDYNEGYDLFELKFYRLKKWEGPQLVKEFKMLYCDQLKEIFEEYTGLRLSFPTIIYR